MWGMASNEFGMAPIRSHEHIPTNVDLQAPALFSGGSTFGRNKLNINYSAKTTEKKQSFDQ